MPRLVSMRVHMPRSMKLKVMSDWFFTESETDVVRRMEVTVTLYVLCQYRVHKGVGCIRPLPDAKCEVEKG